jgi:hypothetical protein
MLVSILAFNACNLLGGNGNEIVLIKQTGIVKSLNGKLNGIHIVGKDFSIDYRYKDDNKMDDSIDIFHPGDNYMVKCNYGCDSIFLLKSLLSRPRAKYKISNHSNGDAKSFSIIYHTNDSGSIDSVFVDR